MASDVHLGIAMLRGNLKATTVVDMHTKTEGCLTVSNSCA